MKYLFLITSLFLAVSASALEPYPQKEQRRKSPGAQTWHVNPANGSDDHNGKTPEQAWKTMAAVNQYLLSEGDTVIVSPGVHPHSLVVMGEGSAKSPITVRFLPGKHIFKHGNLAEDTFHISNTNDAPGAPKAMGIRLAGATHVALEGKKDASYIMLEGKAIFLCSERAQNIKINGLSFDYLHPTMGEFHVTKVEDNSMEATVPEGILYRIQDGRLVWFGPGWEFNMGGYAKVLDTKTGTFRGSFNPGHTRIEELSPGKLKIVYTEGAPSMEAGQSYQNRNTHRDYCGFFQYRSRNISWKNCNIHYMHGMGVVSQFSENLMFDNLKVAPPEGTLRTVASWADNLHFSGCKGKIIVKDSLLGSSHDDAINVHGTHLRITGQPAGNKLKVRFMHNQSFGFDAFIPGDKIDYVSFETLVPYASNTVTKVEPVNEREIILTLAKPNPENVQPDDAVENITWTPSVHVKNTVVRRDPTRGFLLTTRQPVVIENCRFEKTGMPAILVEDDASGWYESGVVRDMKILNNTFIECAEPVIQIIPHAPRPNGAVHKNITIKGNTFELKGGTAVRTRHTDNVTLKDNKFLKEGPPATEASAADVQ